MSISTYDELVDEVKSFINFSDIDDRLSGFIRLTEAQMDRRLEVRELDQIVSYQVNSADVSMPHDFKKLHSFYQSDGGTPLVHQPIEQLEARTSRTGNPCFYSIVGDGFVFWPVPASNVTLRLRYRKWITPLTENNAVNDILKRYPDMYLYGCLMQASQYLRENESFAQWSALFETAIEDANTLNANLVKQRIRMKPSGAPV